MEDLNILYIENAEKMEATEILDFLHTGGIAGTVDSMSIFTGLFSICKKQEERISNLELQVNSMAEHARQSLKL